MIKLLKQFNKKDFILVLCTVMLILFQVWLDLKIPDYMSKITTLIQTSGTVIKDVLIQGAYMLICAFGSLLAAVIPSSEK